MKAAVLTLTLLFPAGTVLGAIGYAKFSHPKGDYVLEFPSNWKQSYGLQSLGLRPRGRSGSDVRISVERFPAGKGSPESAEKYIKEILKPVGVVKKLDARANTVVSGRASQRVALSETVVLKGKFGPIPGPMREIHVVVPIKKNGYYVLKIEGLGRTYQQALPEFERLVQHIKIR